MEEDGNAAKTPEEREPEETADAPLAETQGEDAIPAPEGSLPSQESDPQSGAGPDAAEPMEAAEDVEAQAAQEVLPGETGAAETSTDDPTIGLPDVSRRAGEHLEMVPPEDTRMLVRQEASAGTSLEEGQVPVVQSREKVHVTFSKEAITGTKSSKEKAGSTGSIEEEQRPASADTKKHKKHKEQEKGKTRPPKTASTERAQGTPRAKSKERMPSRERIRRSSKDPSPRKTPSVAGSEGQESPLPMAVPETEQDGGSVVLVEEPSLEAGEVVIQEISEQTAPEERAPSQNQIAASSEVPFEEEESVVSTAIPGMMLEESSRPLSEHPLSLTWVFGYNCHLPVFSLLDEEYRVILYISAHTAVIHDVLRNKQYLLQGHSSCISCVCVSHDRRWIATADQGPESMLIVWDSYSAVPVHTIFDSHPEGGAGAIAISHNCKFLATIGTGKVQKVCIWRWTSAETKPVCSVELLPQFGIQNYVAFNPKDHTELVTNSDVQVIFYIWDSDSLHHHAPLLTDKTFNKVVGIFSQSIFHFDTAQAITGTLGGKLVVWDAVCSLSKAAPLCKKPYTMKAIKLVHLQKDGITVLAIMEKNFVTCDVKGHVKFYDGDLQLLHWYSQLKLGPIQSISFSKNPACPVDFSKHPASCTLEGHPFIVRNFIVATTEAVVIHVVTEGLKISKCLEEPREAIHAITCHPRKPFLAKGSDCGLLKVWNYKRNKYTISRIFKEESIRCLSYNSDGSLLAAGFVDGSVYILDSISLENHVPEPFQYSRGPITLMSFSHNSQYLATADENISVTLYKQVMVDNKLAWQRLAALHSHYKPIRTILFGVHLDSDEPWLLSLGEDRLLVEYDLEKCVKGELVISRRDRIEQSAVPKSIAWYPSITLEYFFITANDYYKIKLYNVTTKLCRKTVLGPTYGSPLEKILVLPVSEGRDPERRYLVYITKDKVGLQILPVDGNPHKSCAFICHPSGVSDLVCSHDGCHLFTAGGKDLTVMKWDINLNALDAAVFLGGEDLIPFYNLLDGGREGEFFRELEDYFYYVQLLHQGIDTMEPRKVSTHIPVEQIPFVMRAMGFYPSEEQIEDMLNEVKFSEYLETGKQVTEINLGDFIRLYVNHRPAFGLLANEVQNAFRVLGYENKNQELSINRNDLLHLLQDKGEHFTEEELAECLTTLLGVNPEGGRAEVGFYDSTGAEAFIEEEIPEEITATHFTTEILCLPVREPTTSTEPETRETTNELEIRSSNLS